MSKLKQENSFTMKITNKLKSFLKEIKDLFSHDCSENKKLIGIEASTMFGKQRISKKTYRCQKCLRIWEEGNKNSE